LAAEKHGNDSFGKGYSNHLNQMHH